jgi:hypothetical protein
MRLIVFENYDEIRGLLMKYLDSGIRYLCSNPNVK